MNSKFSTTSEPIKLYRNPLSGHCHRVELMLSLLDLPYQCIDLDMANGAHKTPEYLEKSRFGQVPAIDDNGFVLADSNAILTYLCLEYDQGYPWLPSDAKSAAEVQAWLSVAAGEIASGPCAVRLVKLFSVELDYERALAKTYALFDVMEAVLSTRPFLASDRITLADVAGYSYVSHAPEGGAKLEAYPAIRAWLERIETQPRFVAMARSPIAA